MKKFFKTLSANDVGLTGGHMAGICVPKSDSELLSFLPLLDPTILNPSAWIDCESPDGSRLRLRFVYYNNRLHIPGGTRNEYRITHLTAFLRNSGARKGDIFEIAKADGSSVFRIRVIAKEEPKTQNDEEDQPIRIKLRSGWSRVH